MKWLVKNIVIAIWAFVIGLVLAYITSQLQLMKADYVTDGLVAMVAGLIMTNGMSYISIHANPHRNH
ncbi:MAG TPA: DUF2929 family protein [Candidatus Limosilactobacillus merdipullorum]|uniref:DUF2929 family protein n=1 Tax=Candidatus Limosilactobacillus merdipullorum TaxID=2838653 RepID=A0A9D1U338_9LACO|nr:DUF2929 family protein [Candidatus Limosilactobacillus merdipullorum]